MLPPKELLERCPQCDAELPPTKRFCNACGADREALLVATRPAVESAQRWMLLVAALSVAMNALLYYHLRDRVPEDRAPVVFGSGFALSAAYVVAWLWAKRQPLVAAVIALVLFFGVFAAQLVQAPVAHGDAVGIAARGVLALALAVTLDRAYRAHRLQRSGVLARARARPATKP